LNELCRSNPWDLNKSLISMLVLTMLLATLASAAELKFPYFYAFMMMGGCMQPLECDYTSKTCLRRFRIGGGGVVGDVLDGGESPAFADDIGVVAIGCARSSARWASPRR
jgi:hypothetical protein